MHSWPNLNFPHLGIFRPTFVAKIWALFWVFSFQLLFRVFSYRIFVFSAFQLYFSFVFYFVSLDFGLCQRAPLSSGLCALPRLICGHLSCQRRRVIAMAVGQRGRVATPNYPVFQFFFSYFSVAVVVAVGFSTV